ARWGRWDRARRRAPRVASGCRPALRAHSRRTGGPTRRRRRSDEGPRGPARGGGERQPERARLVALAARPGGHGAPGVVVRGQARRAVPGRGVPSTAARDRELPGVDDPEEAAPDVEPSYAVAGGEEAPARAPPGNACDARVPAGEGRRGVPCDRCTRGGSDARRATTPMTYEVGDSVEVHALHRMPVEGPEGELHGHDYRIHVVVSRAVLDDRGMVIDLDTLDVELKAVRAEL